MMMRAWSYMRALLRDHGALAVRQHAVFSQQLFVSNTDRVAGYVQIVRKNRCGGQAHARVKMSHSR